MSIFFPAEKETSKLKFHIHAPFASTVARDSIKDLDENRDLIKDIAGVVADSLEFIKYENLLNIDFFEVLPIPDDELTNLYLPIQKKIYDSFQEYAFLPTESGYFTNAKKCFICQHVLSNYCLKSKISCTTGFKNDILFLSGSTSIIIKEV